jgi:hypothetical protein
MSRSGVENEKTFTLSAEATWYQYRWDENYKKLRSGKPVSLLILPWLSSVLPRKFRDNRWIRPQRLRPKSPSNHFSPVILPWVLYSLRRPINVRVWLASPARTGSGIRLISPHTYEPGDPHTDEFGSLEPKTSRTREPDSYVYGPLRSRECGGINHSERPRHWKYSD